MSVVMGKLPTRPASSLDRRVRSYAFNKSPNPVRHTQRKATGGRAVDLPHQFSLVPSSIHSNLPQHFLSSNPSYTASPSWKSSLTSPTSRTMPSRCATPGYPRSNIPPNSSTIARYRDPRIPRSTSSGRATTCAYTDHFHHPNTDSFQSLLFRKLRCRRRPTRRLLAYQQPLTASIPWLPHRRLPRHQSFRYVQLSNRRIECSRLRLFLSRHRLSADNLLAVAEPIEISGKVITPRNLYVALFVVGQCPWPLPNLHADRRTGLPLLWFAAPLSTFFWLVGSSGCLVGAHAGLMEPGVES